MKRDIQTGHDARLPKELSYTQKERVRHIIDMHWAGGGNGVTSMRDSATENINKYLNQERSAGKLSE